MSANELVPAAKPTRRMRGILYAGALLICGGVIGAVVAGPTLGQGGPDGPRWQRGWNDRQSQDDGPGWRHRFGGRGFGMRQDDDGMRGDGRRGGRFAGRMLTPGGIERRVNRVLGAVDASTEQRQKVRSIFEAAAKDLYPIRQKRMETRKQICEALAAATIDRAKIEQLRTERMKLADDASKRLTAAITDAAEVLTPAQRADLARRAERWRRG